ncbi:hypothetical protein [Nocardia blacklockiae]|uniref:hypothetical protein n=1 Tax=Nocardia blacklockiae TaxID=480036 RepID=UPI0018937F0D|nr:hypothetical protein [Nocardia blacklockiae]MBF6172510.1 hypothetical protein [Nocardia blacklockiae]
MSETGWDPRMRGLEGRVTDIEESYGASILRLSRDVVGLKLANGRLFDGMNALGSGMARMMTHMGLAPIEVPVVVAPTESEIDAAFEHENS